MMSLKPQNSGCNTHFKAEDAEGQGGGKCQPEVALDLEAKSPFPCPLLACSIALPASYALHKALMQPCTARRAPLGGSAGKSILQELGQEAPARAGPGKIRTPYRLVRLQAF